MTALLIVAIALCGLVFLFDLAIVVQGNADYDDSDVVGGVNLVPLALAITTMSITLAVL